VGQVAYTYDVDGHLITEATAGTGVKTREYIWLPANDNSPVDLPLAIIDIVGNTATISYVHADHLGRPIRMTSPTKTTLWAARWKPWGEVQAFSGTNTTNLRYPGQYFQIETGLHYNHHRMYDPVTGRYTQPDPLRFVDGPSVYAYAKNSPFMRTDREGLITLQIGISGSFNIGPFAGSFGFGLAIDDNGNIGGYGVYGGGVGLGGNASIGINIDGSNGDTICDLGGLFAYYSGGAGAGPHVGGNFFTGYGQDGKTPVVGEGATFGVGVGAGGSTSISNTTVKPFN
jgi:RHS repeat-associated protein